MGFVIKKLGNVYVGTDNPFTIIIDDNDKHKLQIENKLINKNAMGIIIYSEIDFDLFYKKHCARIPNDDKPFTILVENNINIPTRKGTRELIEKSLLTREAILRKDKSIIIDIDRKLILPIKYKARTYFEGKFIPNEEPYEGKFRFKDINKNVHLNNIGEEFLEIQNLWKQMFTSNCDYIIKYVWLIGHIDVI